MFLNHVNLDDIFGQIVSYRTSTLLQGVKGRKIARGQRESTWLASKRTCYKSLCMDDSQFRGLSEDSSPHERAQVRVLCRSIREVIA